jgi:hypothetical protein
MAMETPAPSKETFGIALFLFEGFADWSENKNKADEVVVRAEQG